MEKFNINYLSKDELRYEILCRNQESTHDNVESLRKELRCIISTLPDISNLTGKLSVNEEFNTVQTKIDLLGLLIEQAEENPTNLQIAKIKAKLSHVQLRITNLKQCQVIPSLATTLGQLESKIRDLTEKFLKVKNKISDQDLEIYQENLNKSLLEEEEINAKSDLDVNEMTTSNESSTPIKPNQVVINEAKTTLEANSNFYPMIPVNVQDPSIQVAMLNSQQAPNLNPNPSIFNKLSNPAEAYLHNITITNGLDINPLLAFLRNLVKIRSETNLTDFQLYEILPSYSQPPLSTKILQGKIQGLTLDKVHEDIINTFIPITLREKLKQELVYRPQYPSEPLSLYINEVKISNQILKTKLSEPELICFIKNGLRPEIRNQIIFESNPKTFSDLEQLCISLNNIGYNDYLRDNMYRPTNQTQVHNFTPQQYFQPTSNNFRPNFTPQCNQQSKPHQNQARPYYSSSNHDARVKTCFNCNRKGHIASQCYRKKKNS